MFAIFLQPRRVTRRTSALCELSAVFAFRRNFTRDISPLTGENNKTRIVIIPPVPLQPLSHTRAHNTRVS